MPYAEINPQFSEQERQRLQYVCRALRTSYSDFIHFATMQAIGECEMYAQQYEIINQFYKGEQ
jgi:hypothetical protein